MGRLQLAVAVGVLVSSLPSLGNAKTESNPVTGAINLIKKYNVEEINLSNENTVSATLLVSHWKRLDLVAANLEQLEKTGRLRRMDAMRWQALRHELVTLFEVVPEVVDRPNAKILAADLKRKQNLIRIALIANQRFDLGIREVLGVRLDGGVS